jgi:hypothetical protein
MSRSSFLLALLGGVSLLAYLAALGLGDLRKNTPGFEAAFFSAFVVYLGAVAVVLRPGTFAASRLTLPLVVLFGILFRLVLLPSRPTLSDDMYRYVWDGRVQAHGLSPYRYPPNAPETLDLRKGDGTVWRYINRKSFVTVYPPGAQLTYAGVWQVVRDSVTGFKAAFVLAELAGAWLLLRLLKSLNQPAERVLIYLWSPLLVFEVAHAGHVDGVMLPLLVAAFWARVKDRPWLLGLSLGAAALVKLFPLILLPALLPWAWSRQGLAQSAKTLLGFSGIVGAAYLIYWIREPGVLGFLPHYFDENFNLGLARLLFDWADHWQVGRSTLANAVTFGGLLGLSGLLILRPAGTGKAALIRCVWLVGWFTLFTQNLFPWYLLWLLPLAALFAEPGPVLGLKLAPMSAWLLFTGAVALAYTFFIRWRVVPWAQAAEFWPVYALLLASAVASVWPRLSWRREGKKAHGSSTTTP